jgi:ATP-binding cassette subfamily D (ALD) protein 4
MFVPQKPFFTDGTMRQQVIYPLMDDTASMSSDEEEINGRVLSCLERVDLTALVNRLGGVAVDSNWNWLV